MSKRRDIRRLAMQALYQLDMRGDEDMDALTASLAEAPGTEGTHQQALALAREAWAQRTQADQAVLQLSPDWPTHRQPPVDRAILRLAHYEMASGRVPVKVAINEAVELAKAFGTRESPNFINGVLDRLARQLPLQPPPPQTPGTPEPPEPPETPKAQDPWLSDALDS